MYKKFFEFLQVMCVCVYLVLYTMTGYNTEEHLVIGIKIR